MVGVISNLLVNSVYPLDYFTLQGVDPILYPDTYWWSSKQRFASEGPSGYLSAVNGGIPTSEYLEIDLGTVREVNYLSMDLLRVPIDISIEYDVISGVDGVHSWVEVLRREDMPYASSLSYDANNRNAWFSGEFYFNDPLQNMVNTRYLRIKFVRRDEQWPVAGTAPFAWPIFVKNLRSGRYVAKESDTIGMLLGIENISGGPDPSAITYSLPDDSPTVTHEVRQQFRLPANSTRGTITPEILGLGVLIQTDPSKAFGDQTGSQILIDDHSWNWSLFQIAEVGNPNFANTLLQSGTTTGVASEGKTWLDFYFPDGVTVEADLEAIYELRIRSLNPVRSREVWLVSPSQTSKIILPGTLGFVSGSSLVNTSLDLSGFLKPGSLISNTSSTQVYTVSLVTSNTIALTTLYREATQAGASGSLIDPLSQWNGTAYTPNPGLSLVMRVWGNIADTGRDVLGNAYRYATSKDSAEHVLDGTQAGWMSGPQPSANAVEALYFDIRQNPEDQVDVAIQYPTTPALDLFNRADGNPGTNWIQPSIGDASTMVIKGQAATTQTGGSFGAMRWHEEFGPDVEVYTTLSVMPAGAGVSIYYRIDDPTSGTFNGYDIGYNVTSGRFKMARWDGGSVTILAQPVFSVSPGDSYGIRMVGPVMSLYWKASWALEWTFITSVVDATHDTGGWVVVESPDSTCRIDMVGGGSYAPSTNPTPIVGGSAPVMGLIDAIAVAPRTPGVTMHIYHTQGNLNGTAPTTRDQWDNLVWTPINDDFILRHNTTIELPTPLKASFVKLEFTNLRPLPFRVPSNPTLPPQDYYTYPTWVEQQYSNTQVVAAISSWFTLNATPVQKLALQQITDPVAEFQYEQREYLASLALAAAGSTENVNGGILSTTQASIIDPVTASQIYIQTPAAYQNTLLLNVDQNSILGQMVANRFDTTTASQTVEAPAPPSNGGIPLVSSASNRITESYSTLAQMPLKFNQRSRHAYKVQSGQFNNKAYFVGIAEVAFLRSLVTQTHDDPVIIDILFDDAFFISNTWEKEDQTQIPDGTSVYLNYQLNDASNDTFTDEFVALNSFDPVALLGEGGQAINARMFAGPNQTGVEYFLDWDFSLSLIPNQYGTLTNYVSRSTLSERLTAPKLSIGYRDFGTVVGHALIPSPPTIDAGVVTSIAAPRTAAEGKFWADSTVVHSTAVPSGSDGHTVHDFSVVSSTAIITSVAHFNGHDTGTVSGRAAPSASDTLGAHDAGTVTGISKISGTLAPLFGQGVFGRSDATFGKLDTDWVDLGTISATAVPSATGSYTPHLGSPTGSP